MAAKRTPPKTVPQFVSDEVEVPGVEGFELDISSLSAHIAAELAAGLSDAKAVRDRYGISMDQWNVLRMNPVFRDMLKESIIKLRGDLNAGKRITLKSEIALEDSIETLYVMASDKGIPAAARVESIKTLASLAGRNMKGDATVATGGSGFAINIQINTGTEERVVSIADADTPRLAESA